MLLDNVTLCAIDSVQPILAKKAMERCKRQVNFGAEVFIDANISSKQEYSKFVIYELHKYIKLTLFY